MAKDNNFLTDAKKSFLGDEDEQQDQEFYSKDVQAAAIADNNMDPEILADDTEETPVTSQNMKMGNLDDDSMLDSGDEHSYDEAEVPAGDNVSDN